MLLMLLLLFYFVVLKDEKEVKEKLREYVENEEYISFVVNKLSVRIGIEK